jgi:hypothetical protein
VAEVKRVKLVVEDERVEPVKEVTEMEWIVETKRVDT